MGIHSGSWSAQVKASSDDGTNRMEIYIEKLGIYESFKVKQALVLSTPEASETILHVDEIIKCNPWQNEKNSEQKKVSIKSDPCWTNIETHKWNKKHILIFIRIK
jgi:hypothetical protein